MEVGHNFSDKAKRDLTLVQAAMNGDQKAFSDLLDLYKDSIYFMLLKMVNNKIDAEDLTIEAFGKAFKNIDLYTPNFAFSTWLFKIATNNCIDYLRKKKMEKKTVSIDKEEVEDGFYEPQINLMAEDPDPEEVMIMRQKEVLLKSIVQKLNLRYRRLIELRYFDELSYLEIANELKIPVGTVKARLFRSRELLLNILKKTKANL